MRPDRWEKAAERETARREKAAGPLFAAFVTPADPEAVKARAEKQIEAFNRSVREGHAASEIRGRIARATLAEHVTPEELAELDRRRACAPKTGEYTADHYCGECRRLGLPWPGQEKYDALWSVVNAALAEEWARQDAAAEAAGEQLDLPTGFRLPVADGQRIAVVPVDEREAAEDAAELEAINALRTNARIASPESR